MGTMGLALPWEHRIPPVPRDRERRVEPFREPAIPTGPVGLDPAAEAARAEDSALAAACQSGDLRAYERLYALQGARMKNLARNLLGNPLDAEDAVQDTFLKVQRSIDSFRGQSSFVTWTFRILVNTCHDARRKRVRKKEVANEDETGELVRPEVDAPPARRFLAVRGRRLPPFGNRRDAGNYGSRLQEHALSSEEESSRNAGTSAQHQRRRSPLMKIAMTISAPAQSCKGVAALYPERRRVRRSLVTKEDAVKAGTR
jgi:RNA polymerase sigma factor (sigma-70 family)